MVILKRERILTVLIQFFIITFLTSYYATIPIVLLVVFFFYDKKENIITKIKKAYSQPILLLFQAYFFIHLIGLTYTSNMNNGTNMVTRLLPFLILPILFIGEDISANTKKKILLFFKNAIIIILLALFCFHFWYFDKGLEWFIHFGFKSIGISHVYYSSFLILALFVTNKYRDTYYYISIFIVLFFLLLLANRSSIIFLIFYFLFYKKGYEKLVKPLFIIGIIFAILFLALIKNPLSKKISVLKKTIDFDMEIIKTKNSITITRNSFEHRIYIWYLSSKISKENLLIGVGTGDFQEKLNEKYNEYNFKAAIKNKYNSHNQFMEEFLKFGVIGELLFLIIFGYLLFFYSENKILVSVILLLIWFNLFESYLSRHHGIVFMSFIIPFLIKKSILEIEKTTPITL